MFFFITISCLCFYTIVMTSVPAHHELLFCFHQSLHKGVLISKQAASRKPFIYRKHKQVGRELWSSCLLLQTSPIPWFIMNFHQLPEKPASAKGSSLPLPTEVKIGLEQVCLQVHQSWWCFMPLLSHRLFWILFSTIHFDDKLVLMPVFSYSCMLVWLSPWEIRY